MCDFLKWLGADMSIEVFLHLNDPADLARVCSVSSSWCHFVIKNGLAKQLFFKLLPEMSSVARGIEGNDMIEPIGTGGSGSSEWEYLKRKHSLFAQLARGLAPISQDDCISEAMVASSTDNYPDEGIWNTLEPNDRAGGRASYWSSKGQSDAAVPEMLVYKLIANLCLVTEIRIHPFQAYFQFGFPIYSSKAVRFRLGHPKHPLQLESYADFSSVSNPDSINSNFIWTYTSPEYPMTQENCLQKFKLPEPVICIGGILQVELLGRVQRQEIDGLYYICISHVAAVGRPLLRPFDIEILDSRGRCALKYNPERECSISPSTSVKNQMGGTSRLHSFTLRLMNRGIRRWENMILNTLLGIRPDEEQDSEDEHLEGESDGEFLM